MSNNYRPENLKKNLQLIDYQDFMNKNLQIFETGLLFETVQLSQIFSDNKTFVDCLPKHDLAKIQQHFLAEKDLPNFDLKAFVHANFDFGTC
jgi:neutral trehalase